MILLLQRCRRIPFQIGIKNLRKPTTMEEHRNRHHCHYHRRRHGYQDPSIPINSKFVSKHIHIIYYISSLRIKQNRKHHRPSIQLYDNNAAFFISHHYFVNLICIVLLTLSLILSTTLSTNNNINIIQ